MDPQNPLILHPSSQIHNAVKKLKEYNNQKYSQLLSNKHISLLFSQLMVPLSIAIKTANNNYHHTYVALSSVLPGD